MYGSASNGPTGRIRSWAVNDLLQVKVGIERQVDQEDVGASHVTGCGAQFLCLRPRVDIAEIKLHRCGRAQFSKNARSLVIDDKYAQILCKAESRHETVPPIGITIILGTAPFGRRWLFVFQR